MNHAIEIRQTQSFLDWFSNLRDKHAKARIQARIDRMSLGNFGDCAPVGEGVSELRIHYGPGYRVYLVQRGDELVILWAAVINAHSSATSRQRWSWHANYRR